MKFLGALFGASFFESLSTTEWVYFGVGIAALVALTVTIIVAVKSKKNEQPKEEKSVESTAEPTAVATAEPTVAEKAVVKDNKQNNNPIAVVAQPDVKQQPVIEQKPQQVTTNAVVKDHPDHEVIKRGKVLIRYDKSQTAKLMQSDKVVKDYYDIIKNELLSYKSVRCRLSWKHEAFYKGRVCVAKLKVRGKHLRLLLPLNPKDYIDTKYKVKDLSDKKAHADTPCGYAIKNDRRSVYAKDLIATVMQANGALKLDGTEFVKYSLDFPYDTTEHLIRRKLIKLIYSKAVDGEEGEYAHYEPVEAITAEEVTGLMTDEEAEESVEESSRIADKTKTGIVNVDVLSKVFEAGEKVTLDEIKKRVVGFNKKITYVKVLARGVVDKPLIVEADDYSLDAVKMILLTGGTVIRTRKK
ncbi:MAG: uL15 family ribosomal protein [Clostridiales bacterium]|nr:uL15 family ribosomal protein [Clostridiales bacterium]